MRSTIRGKSFCPYFATFTSVAKFTSVMSFASLSVFRNLTAAERESLMSSDMLPLVSNSRPTCISGPVSVSAPRAKYLIVCFLPVFEDLEVVGRQIREELALAIDHRDAEGGEIDPGAEDRCLGGSVQHRDSRQRDEHHRHTAPAHGPQSYTRGRPGV